MKEAKLNKWGKYMCVIIFEGINIISKLYGKLYLSRGCPAQKTRTGHTAGLQQHPDVARLKEMPIGSGTPDSNGAAVGGQHGPDAQSDSGVPRQPRGPRFA